MPSFTVTVDQDQYTKLVKIAVKEGVTLNTLVTNRAVKGL